MHYYYVSKHCFLSLDFLDNCQDLTTVLSKSKSVWGVSNLNQTLGGGDLFIAV